MMMDMDFRTRTNMGYTYCNRFDSISGNLRDVTNVDYVISTVKKLFSKVNFDPCITFRADSITCGRITEDWKDGTKGYTFIRFTGNGEKIETWKEKLTTKDIKIFFLNCVESVTEKVA